MINFNGTLVPQNSNILTQNRGFLYGDAVFETVKIMNSKVLYLEDHYFRLMASMRVVRMEIPMDFTMEFFENQLLALTDKLAISESARVRITVFRNDGGYYLPVDRTVSFLVHATALDTVLYSFEKKVYEVDLFKDFYITKQLLSSIKSTNRMLNVTASIFANENGLDNCLLLNDSKNIVEAIHGNFFMIKGNKLITPPISEGCLNGVMRKQILKLAKTMEGLEVIEDIISPFELQKADELFITNVIRGIQPITRYRKKTFKTEISKQLIDDLNKLIVSS